MDDERAVGVVTRFWEALDAMAWDAAGAELRADIVVGLPDSGRVLTTREQVVAFNAGYPGRSRCAVRRTLGRAGPVAAETEVVNDRLGRFRCAGFSEVDDGVIVAADECWVGPSDATWRRPPRRRQAGRAYRSRCAT
ncbi:hypothetical protein [Jatrophihabitans endophyticus]|uniref:hypothetical protein n=1 Tax=Jatrophihabitans endophyticus TaxID=1206085 RepID=UPI0011611D9F|nr:hypothetical protein [Jatrophihabitans endophyticus]